MITKIYEYLSGLFRIKKKEKDKLTSEYIFDDYYTPLTDCLRCINKVECENKIQMDNFFVKNSNCSFKRKLEDFNEKLDTFFIIDDNEGIASFLEDDVRFLAEKKIIDLDKINILTITGNYAAFRYESLENMYESMNIKWAIIDITLGGSIMTAQGNIKYNGIDVFRTLYKKNPDVKFLFYTGNNLNPYIKINRKILKDFKDIMGADIKDYILFKTSMDMNIRRKYIAKKMFGKTYD